ncbi:MAG: hypothetical protein F6J98_15695 [Moorea sp. SIO4G2]|nr:hypothetical protein [Moorena sp. SIO4G2]
MTNLAGNLGLANALRAREREHKHSAISYQLSAISYQLSAISYQLKAKGLWSRYGNSLCP